jgi:hypothetical protein
MGYVEKDCTIEHEGHKFTSGGAAVTDQWLVAYLSKDGTLTDWHGNKLGTWLVLSSWPIRSYMSSTMYSVACYVDGVRYVGRSCGIGMVVRAKRSPQQHSSAVDIRRGR